MSGRRDNTGCGEGGFSLVEMMVAMVIALIALGAVSALYLSSSQTARFHAAVQQVQENGRFATDMLSRSARMGGYDNPLDTVALPTVWLKGTVSSTGTIFTQSGLKSSGDTVGLSLQGGTGIRDCQGRAVAASSYAINLYAVSTANQLVCASQHVGGSTTTYAAIPLAEGVEDMVVLYGVDLDSDRIANRYVAAGSVTNWNQVISMRITLLVNSVTPALVDPATVCMGCVVFTGIDDRLVRAEFETTIGLRNPASS